MVEPVHGQFAVFFYTLVTGALAGFLFDIYSGIGQVLRLRRTGIMVGDIIFWLILTGLVFVVFLLYNQGKVRFFLFLGLGLGAWLYYQLCSRLVRGWVVKVLETALRVSRWAVSVTLRLLYVFFFPFRLAFAALAFPFRLTGRLWRKARRLLLTPAKRLLPDPAKAGYRRFAGGCKKVLGKISRRK